MQKPSQSDIDAHWDSLSGDVREAIISEETNSLIKSYATKNSVPEKEADIRQILNFRLFGFVSDEDMLSELIKSFGGTVGKNIYDDLVIGILSPIRDYLPKPPEKEDVRIAVPSVETEVSAPKTNVITDTSKTELPSPAPLIDKAEETIDTPSADMAPVVDSTPIETPPATGPVIAPVKPTGPSTIAGTPAPFIIHQETDLKPVIESPGSGHWSPLRPSFYTPEIEEMREEKLTFAKLEFGGAVPKNEEKTPEPIVPAAENLKKNISSDNIIDLRDLPL
ncbi:MAG: hypothetical protein PHG66_01315 [Candidatus Colwellbacteria bacterium]|nr:hypothetical protein [Candidatus Colwellbacteria bacterium]